MQNHLIIHTVAKTVNYMKYLSNFKFNINSSIYTIIDLNSELQLQETNGGLHHNLLSYCRQIASGMNYLTTKCFVHRDLAARNVLLSSENVCKVQNIANDPCMLIARLASYIDIYMDIAISSLIMLLMYTDC